MGGELSRLRRSHRRDVRHGEDVRPHGIVRLEGQIAALTADPDVQRRRLHRAAAKGHRGVRHGVGRRGSTRRSGGAASCGRPTRRRIARSSRTSRARRRTFFANNDANDLILQARTWERHDVGTTPGFDGDVEKALRSIKVPLLYMPSETDLYFPVGDAKYEAQFIPRVTLVADSVAVGPSGGRRRQPGRSRVSEREDRRVSAVN